MSTDTVSIQISKAPERVFEFMSDPSCMDLWSFGTWNIDIKDDVVYGQSLFDGSTNLVRIIPNTDGLRIDYEIGQQAHALEPRIHARVVACDNDTSCSVLSLTAKRTEAMNDSRWQSLHDIHKVELLLIKSLLETGYDHRQ